MQIKYRKKPVVIEAIEFTGTTQNLFELTAFMSEKTHTCKVEAGNLYIETLEGTMKANIGDFIIKGVRGEFYPCKPDVFEATYEMVL